LKEIQSKWDKKLEDPVQMLKKKNHRFLQDDVTKVFNKIVKKNHQK